jgi:hypothetical protein
MRMLLLAQVLCAVPYEMVYTFTHAGILAMGSTTGTGAHAPSITRREI